MSITARLAERHQQTNTNDELVIDAAFVALSSEPAPYTVRQFVEEMEDAGASFGFQDGVFCQYDGDADPARLSALRSKAIKAGITFPDVKRFLIAGSRPGPSPVPAPKTLIDLEAFKLRIRDLDAKDLVEVFDGLLAASNAMQGILNRPRCQEGAGEQLEHLLDDLCAAYSAIVSEIETRELTYENALSFFHIAAAYEVHCEAPPMTLASIAVKYAEASTL